MSQVLQFEETINLENAKKVIQIDYEDYILLFKSKDNQDQEFIKEKKYSSKTYFKYIKNWLKKVVKRNKSTYISKYKYSTNQTNGRIYVRGGQGIQSVPSLLKCYLLEGVNVTDYDMVNAHFRILKYICKKNNVNPEQYHLLNNYCENREQFLKIFKCNKMDCIRCLYTDKSRFKRLDNFHKELVYLKKTINVLEKININVETTSKNPNSAITSKILCYYENKILQKVINKYKCYIPYYDGFIGEPGIDVKKLNNITKEYGIEWSIKSLKNNIDLDHVDIINPEKINNKLDFFENCGQEEYAEYFLNRLLEDKDKYIYFQTTGKGLWYEYDKFNILKEFITAPPSLKKNIDNLFKQEMINIENLINEVYDNGHSEYKFNISRIKKLKKYVTTNIFQKNIIEKLTYMLHSSTLLEDLNTGNDKICFKNKLYDFKIQDFRAIKKSDFITNHLNYNLPEKNIEIQKKINNIINSIFDEEELRKYFWDHITFSLWTNRFELLHIYVGCGSNGKGIVLQLLENCLGCYMNQPNSQFLTSQTTGPNSALANCRGKKIVFVSEPETSSSGNLKFNTQFIKKITGRDSISCRALYQNEQIFIPEFTLFTATNELPEIDTQDNSIVRRFVILPFKNCFIPEQDFTERHRKNKKYRIGNPLLKDEIKNNPLIAQQFMLMLIDRSKGMYNKNLKIPEECKKITKEYINSNNIVKEFITEKYDFDDSKDKSNLINTSELFNNFKHWEGYNGLSKKKFKYNLLQLNGVREKRTNRARCIEGLKLI